MESRLNNFQLKRPGNSLSKSLWQKEEIRYVHKELLNINCNLIRLLILTETIKETVKFYNRIIFVFKVISTLSHLQVGLLDSWEAKEEFSWNSSASIFFSLVLHKQSQTSWMFKGVLFFLKFKVLRERNSQWLQIPFLISAEVNMPPIFWNGSLKAHLMVWLNLNYKINN